MSPLPPSSFLPRLPKSTLSLSPLPAATLLLHLESLKFLLITPVHGTVSPAQKPSEDSATSSHGPDKQGGNGVCQEEHGPLDDFERGWVEGWLNGVIRRGEGWLSDVEDELEEIVSREEDTLETEEEKELKAVLRKEITAREQVLDRASGLIAMMAGCSGTYLVRHILIEQRADDGIDQSAAGNLMRTISFPLHPSLHNAAQRPLTTLPTVLARALPTTSVSTTLSTPALTPSTSTTISRVSSLPSTPPNGPSLAFPTKDTSLVLPLNYEELEIKLHDAALSDHLSVGVQTWGSSILMGKMVAGQPDDYFKNPLEEAYYEEGPNVLELGAGTGLLSILSRKILNRMGGHDVATRNRERSMEGNFEDRKWGRVVATDFHPLVLENLKICVDLNFPSDGNEEEDCPIDILPLDWTTFPSLAANSSLNDVQDGEDVNPALRKPFDLIFVSDCVYDTTHAGMIRDCVEWTLKAPTLGEDGEELEKGGVMVSPSVRPRYDGVPIAYSSSFFKIQHLLSPLRPTYAAETASIAIAFPDISSLPPHNNARLAPSDAAAEASTKSPAHRRGLRLVTKRKRELERMRGNGRADEVEYTWWEIGWA